MAAPEVQIDLRECAHCGANVWAESDYTPESHRLDHKDDCWEGMVTFLTPGTEKARKWNQRVDCKILPQTVSPVSENPGEQEFYDRAEESLKKDLDKTVDKYRHD